MEEKETYESEIIAFVDRNISKLGEIPDERGIKLSVLEFLNIHTLFLNVDMTIMALAEALFDKTINKQEGFDKFKKTISSNQKALEDYFIAVLKRNLGDDDDASE